MTQRIFDTDNEEDIKLLWSIFPTNTFKIRGMNGQTTYLFEDDNKCYGSICEDIIKINWHDKTEITRPIQEATGADIGKLCKFWDFDDGERKYGILRDISSNYKYQMYSRDGYFNHARRLTKQEIEKLI